MDVLFTIVAVFLAATAAGLLWSQYRMRQRIAEQEDRLAALTRRVFELEGGLTAHSSTQPTGATPVLAGVVPEGTSAPPPKLRKTQDWESTVGGNWLSRLGSLVLVVGIALFLGYSLTQLGPSGKVAIGMAVGVSMLATGVALRSSVRYGHFAMSLVGGGWSVIYFTSYAAHALEAARVIGSPLVAAGLLLSVSVGMILHAIWYDSQQGTALAFVFSFITLNVTPLTEFSIFGALLLALSMLALAYLRQWFRLAVTGVVLAYATFILRREVAESLAPWALWVQWFAFEAFDILDVSRRGLKRGIAGSVFLLNACGFIGASLLYRWNNIGLFLFLSAGAYLISVAVRARIPIREPDARTRVLGGGYEGALTASAALTAAALIERFSGTNITLALMVEGEMIVLAGLAAKNAFVRGLGGAVLALGFFRLCVVDVPGETNVRRWTPTAFLLAATFLANRVLIERGWAYTAGAAILLAMATHAEVAREWVAFVWALLGIGGLAAGIFRNAPEARLQHMLAAVATFLLGAFSISYGSRTTFPVVLTVAIFYAYEFLVRNRPVERTIERLAGPLYSVLGTGLLTILLFQEIQGRLLTVALGVEGAVLLIAGMIASERILRLSGLTLFLFCIGKAFVYDLRQLDTFGRIVSFIALGLLLLGASWAYTRFRERINRLL